MARTERESDSRRREEKRSGGFVGAAETSKEPAEWRRLQRKNLSILGLLKRRECPQCHRESSWQVVRAAFAKRKRNRAVCPEHQIVRRAFGVREVKKRSSRAKRKRRVFLCRRTVVVAVKDKVTPTSLLKIEGRGNFVEAKSGKRGTVSRIGR